MLLKSFCGCLGLHAGVVIVGFSLIQIAIVILISNLHLLIFWPHCLLFIFVFLLVMLATGVTMVFAAYQESRQISLFALALNVILIAMFIVGSGLSFYNSDSLTDYVCDVDRCPESLWCAPLKFRKYGNYIEDNFTTEFAGTGTWETTSTAEQPEETTTEKRRVPRRATLPEDPIFTSPTTTTTTTSRSTTNSEPDPPDPPNLPIPTPQVKVVATIKASSSDEYVYDTTEEPATPSSYVFGAAFIIAILLFVINSIFFIFCALVVYSYSLELDFIFKLHEF